MDRLRNRISLNKTLPTTAKLLWGENEEICARRRTIVRVEVVAETAVVPVPPAAVPVEVQHVAVAVRAQQKCTECLLCHHTLSRLRQVLDVEFYSVS